MLKYINVFHISQVEGVEPLKECELNKDIEPIGTAEKLLNDYWIREKIEVNHVMGNDAFYNPICDHIQLPLLEQFENVNEYYSAAFHESIHSTMKECRCNRESARKNKNVEIESKEYSKEELIAEIGSAMIMNVMEIETESSFQNSVAYIHGWLSVLRNDNKFIVSASSKAQKAVNYIMNNESSIEKIVDL